MREQPENDPLEWRDGVPISTRFDDPYYSLDDGLAETRHVFLVGNDLPARYRDGFHIAELGFGTGLNLLAALDASPAKLRYTSFEAFPMTRDDLARAVSGFDLEAGFLIDAWQQESFKLQTPALDLEIIIGDARETLPNWTGKADAWFLDGFSPAKNPELWGYDLMSEVGRHTAPGGTFATYTAAGFVRRGLEGAGFEIARVPGYGRKRHMTRGALR